MTREEIRNNAATNYGYAVAGGCIERGYIQDAFERGAEWADANPVNPWHKVFDDAYPKGEYVFAKIKGRRPEIIHVSNLVHYHYWMEIPKNEED